MPDALPFDLSGIHPLLGIATVLAVATAPLVLLARAWARTGHALDQVLAEYERSEFGRRPTPQDLTTWSEQDEHDFATYLADRPYNWAEHVDEQGQL